MPIYPFGLPQSSLLQVPSAQKKHANHGVNSCASNARRLRSEVTMTASVNSKPAAANEDGVDPTLPLAEDRMALSVEQKSELAAAEV